MSQSFLEPVAESRPEDQSKIAERSALSTQHSAPTAENSVEQPLAESLRYGTTRAAIASGTAQIVTRVLTVVLSIATARALEPREVGLLGLAVIVVAVISMIGYYPETAAVTARTREGHGKFAVASVAIKAVVTALLLASVALAFPLR